MTRSEVVPPRIQAEAAAWLARLRADNLKDAERTAFHAWLAESALHARAFEALNTVWDSLGAIDRDLLSHQAKQEPGHTRRRVLSGLSLILAGAGAAAYWETAAAEVYQTDIGEQRHIVLKNGCQVFLDADTRLIVRAGAPGSAKLERGCANFRIAVDSSQPFTISAGRQTISAAHSNMDVGQDGDSTSVVVVDGEATIADGSNRDTRKLRAGQRFSRMGSGMPAVDAPALGPLLAWHSGQAIFNDDRLADAVARMNRYSAVKLLISDAATANARISGTYSVGDNLAFANSVAKLLPVEIVYSEKGVAISGYRTP